jgi:transketolase C-terminal domain/subunit
MIRRVTILTAGHVSTTPRMVKAADTLHEVGYTVRVVSAEHVDWAMDVKKDNYKSN